MKPVQIGAGVRIHADCTVGHKNIWDSCEFANKTRTSVLDIMISVFQLTIGLNMSQVRLALIQNSIALFWTDPGIQKAPDPDLFCSYYWIRDLEWVKIRIRDPG